MTDNSTAQPEESPAPLAARAPVRSDSPAFSDFDVNPDIVAALADVGIVQTFAIQELTLPVALAGKDLIGQARTGTGKTLGFGVPLLNRIALPGGDAAAPQALVIAPTRELAVQVSGDISAAGKNDCANAVAGHSCSAQSKADYDGHDWKSVKDAAACTAQGGKTEPFDGKNPNKA